MSTLSRRQFVHGVGGLGLGVLAGCGRLPGQVQAPTRVYQLGHLGGTGTVAEPFRDRLRELGYIEGQNLLIDVRTAPSEAEYRQIVAEFVRAPVDVIVTIGFTPVRAARDTTDTVPIVQAGGGTDLVSVGLAASFARPGGNVTGITMVGTQLIGKQVELLRDTFPWVSRLAVLWNANNPNKARELHEVRTAADQVGIESQSLEVRTAGDFDSVFEAATAARADALIALEEELTNSHRSRIVELAAQSRLPAIYGQRRYVDEGGLMCYAARQAPGQRRAAEYVEQILKGAQPAELPVEQPTTFDLVINLKTADALGLTIPPHVLRQATELIQ